MYVFGGWDGTTYFNDLYLLNLEKMTWKMPHTSGQAPYPRCGHAAVLVGTKLLIHGGFYFNEAKYRTAGAMYGTALRESYLGDLRVLDTTTLVWGRILTGGLPPLPRMGHTLIMSGSLLIMLGGWTLESNSTKKSQSGSGDCEYFRVVNSVSMEWDYGAYMGASPLARFGHTATPIGPHILLFGGWEGTKPTHEVLVLRDITTSQPTER
mmetsp:Transcript_5502/g.3155  ORF Transcript_5502/g.3155 Transcript_5502/m.3155 type:complete len:209 (+) Transcript_5502:333-959(+)